MPQRVAELGVLEALFDLRALAMKLLHLSGGPLLGRDVGDDEAVGVGGVELPVEHHLQLLGRDCLAPPGLRAAVPELLGSDWDAADDQPQGFMLPVVRGELQLGDLRALHAGRESVHASSGISTSFCHITEVRVAEKEKRILRLRP